MHARADYARPDRRDAKRSAREEKKLSRPSGYTCRSAERYLEWRPRVTRTRESGAVLRVGNLQSFRIRNFRREGLADSTLNKGSECNFYTRSRAESYDRAAADITTTVAGHLQITGRACNVGNLHGICRSGALSTRKERRASRTIGKCTSAECRPPLNRSRSSSSTYHRATR